MTSFLQAATITCRMSVEETETEAECFLCFRLTRRVCTACRVPVCCDDHLGTHRPPGSGKCTKFQVSEISGVGRVLVARETIRAGENILTERAVVAGPAPGPGPLCLNCCMPCRPEDVCRRCGWTVCSAECETGEWHSVECPVLSSSPPPPSPCLAAVLPLRLALLARRGDALAARLELLMDHMEDLHTRPDFQSKWYRPVTESLAQTDLTEQEILRGIGIFLTNAANMAPASGRWIFPTFSFISHSCVSNSRFFISPRGEVKVTAVVEIPAGEEVTISYCPPGTGNVTRREKILRLWQFQCRCPRCEDSEELGTWLSAVLCRGCGGAMTAASSLLTAPFTCRAEDCDKEVSRNTVLALVNSLAEEVRDTKPPDMVDMISKLESFLHTQHYLIMDLRQRWVDAIMADKKAKTEAELVRVVEYLQVIMAVNSKIEPGYTVTLGTNLRHLNTAMLGLARLRLDQQKIDKKEFMMVARKAAENIKIAKKCFETTS